MSDIQNKDFSLLTQAEIDTLIGFISENRNEVDSSVLSQNSIDKLLEILRYREGSAKREEILRMGEAEGALADLVTVRSGNAVCVLQFRADSQTEYVILEIKNQESGETMEITPQMFNEGDGTQWGYCVSPLVLNRIARVLGVKYTAETYEAMCRRYAKYIYGDESRKLPFLFLPGNRENIENLL